MVRLIPRTDPYADYAGIMDDFVLPVERHILTLKLADILPPWCRCPAHSRHHGRTRRAPGTGIKRPEIPPPPRANSRSLTSRHQKVDQCPQLGLTLTSIREVEV